MRSLTAFVTSSLFFERSMQNCEDIIGEGLLVPLKTLGKMFKTPFWEKVPGAI